MNHFEHFPDCYWEHMWNKPSINSMLKCKTWPAFCFECSYICYRLYLGDDGTCPPPLWQLPKLSLPMLDDMWGWSQAVRFRRILTCTSISSNLCCSQPDRVCFAWLAWKLAGEMDVSLESEKCAAYYCQSSLRLLSWKIVKRFRNTFKNNSLYQ